MITKFENYKLITETPDKINLDPDKIGLDDEGEYIEYTDDDALPFFCTVNSVHTEVDNVYIGVYGNSHGSVIYHGNNRAYPGRLFFDNKVMAFWAYPNEKLFVSIIKRLEQILDKKIFNNGWRIEIIERNNGDIEKMKFDPDRTSYDYFDGNYSYRDKKRLIPIEEYAGSENVPEEQQIMHMMNWKEKALAKKQGKLNIKGWGSDKTAWDSTHNIEFRQKVYQEKNNNS